MSKGVSQSECNANVQRVIDKIDNFEKTIGREVRDMKNTLYGPQHDNGLVTDVTLLKQQNRIYNAAVSIGISIIVALVTNYAIHMWGP